MALSVVREFSYDIGHVEPLIDVEVLVKGTQRLCPYVSKRTGGLISTVRVINVNHDHTGSTRIFLAIPRPIATTTPFTFTSIGPP